MISCRIRSLAGIPKNQVRMVDEKNSRFTPRQWLGDRRVLIPVLLMFSIVAYAYLHGQTQRRAMKAVEQLGGWTSKERSIYLPWWDRELLSYGNLRTVVLNRPSITDEDVIPILNDLPDIRCIHLDVCGITDQTLEHIGGRSWYSVSLLGTGVTDAGMESLGSCPSVDMLNLTGTSIGDGGLKSLAKIKHIGHLDLSGTKITDAGLLNFIRTGPTCVIVISDTNISPEAIAKARSLSSPTFIVE